MKKYYFLGAAANYSRKHRLKHTFSIGRKKDCSELADFLSKKYDGKAVLTKNGRSALALALKALFKEGDAIIVNGFTCYAVYEAIKAAKMKPIFADINKADLNFDAKTLEKALKDNPDITPAGIIIQNTLGNPVDIEAIEAFSKKHNLKIVEDLAHCAGVKYSDGREAGIVGEAVALSFGKDKSIDTISGGAVILKGENRKIVTPRLAPRVSDALRERFYPMFGAIYRALLRVHLGSAFMGLLLKLHFVQKSADNKLELNRRISKFEAKMALYQLKSLKNSGPIRDFYLVENRDELLAKLRKAGYFFDGFWYEKPVSPKRYYNRVHFNEEKCPVATEVAEKIINIPKYYEKAELAPAIKIIEQYTEKK